MQSEPIHLTSASGICVQLNANGSLRRIDQRDVIVNLFPGNELEGGPTNLYLRRRDGRIESTPLLGPRSPASHQLSEQGFTARGEWGGIRFQLALRLAHSAPAWFWHVALENGDDAPPTRNRRFATSCSSTPSTSGATATTCRRPAVGTGARRRALARRARRPKVTTSALRREADEYR